MDEALEDEFYMRRLDAGLFTLQLIDCIIMEVCCSGVTSVKNCIIATIFYSFCSYNSFFNLNCGERCKDMDGHHSYVNNL